MNRTTLPSVCCALFEAHSSLPQTPTLAGLTAEEAEEKAKAEAAMREEQGDDDDDGDYRKTAQVLRAVPALLAMNWAL